MTSRLIHMKGHQDTGTMTVLPRTAWMNIEMDTAAKKKVEKTQTKNGAWHIPGEPWSCCIAGRKLVKNIKKQLREHMTTEPIMDYWKSKGREAAPGMIIDWDSMGQAMMESSVTEKIGPANLQQVSVNTGKNEPMEGRNNHPIPKMQESNGRQITCDKVSTSNGTETMG